METPPTSQRRPASAYDRRGISRQADLPEPTHEFLALAERRPPPLPSWLFQVVVVLLSGAFALGTARYELSSKAEKSEVRAVDQKLERVLDILCAREPQPQPRACTQTTPTP